MNQTCFSQKKFLKQIPYWQRPTSNSMQWWKKQDLQTVARGKRNVCSLAPRWVTTKLRHTDRHFIDLKEKFTNWVTAKRTIFAISTNFNVSSTLQSAHCLCSWEPADRTTERMSAYPPPARLICRRDSSQESRSVLATPRGGISLEKESFLTGTSPLALCAIVALLGCDCVPMQLKAMTFHGVRGVEKKGGFTGEKQCHWCLKWGPNVITLHTVCISELLTF